MSGDDRRAVLQGQASAAVVASDQSEGPCGPLAVGADDARAGLIPLLRGLRGSGVRADAAWAQSLAAGSVRRAPSSSFVGRGAGVRADAIAFNEAEDALGKIHSAMVERGPAQAERLCWAGDPDAGQHRRSGPSSVQQSGITQEVADCKRWEACLP